MTGGPNRPFHFEALVAAGLEPRPGNLAGASRV